MGRLEAREDQEQSSFAVRAAAFGVDWFTWRLVISERLGIPATMVHGLPFGLAFEGHVVLDAIEDGQKEAQDAAKAKGK